MIRETSYEVTPRKLAAARRAIEKDRERCGLFPEMMQFTKVEDRVDAIAHHRQLWVADRRKIQADGWREARRRLRTLPPTRRAAVQRYWAQSNMPGDPVYLLGIIHDVTAKGVCYWRRMAYLHRLKLMGQGRLKFCQPVEMLTPVFRGP
jgi:hypothetical protein